MPSWSDLVFDSLEAKQRREARSSVGINLPPTWVGLVRLAAEARGMSIASYARRAIMAFAVHDMQQDWTALMQDEPRVRAYGEVTTVPVYEYGAGHGPWKIEGLGTHE